MKFENDVKTYSIQTQSFNLAFDNRVENDVKTYSIQTEGEDRVVGFKFENDVKTYSIKTNIKSGIWKNRLRMM